ncbi:MAG TPA: hypothetical protein ENK84_13265 [Desulfobulbus sp.]|nr:hypothetical protein [Desulfobulbus sp.]
MALIPIETLRRQVGRILKKTLPPAGVKLLSFKRDRSVTVFRLAETKYLLVEQGFSNQECVVGASGLPRLLKTMIKREFPRSHKVRLVKIASPDELTKSRKRV